MQIIEINEAFYVTHQIAYVSKSTEGESPKVKIILTGNPTLFTLSCASVEDRDRIYSQIRKCVLDYKETPE